MDFRFRGNDVRHLPIDHSYPRVLFLRVFIRKVRPFLRGVKYFRFRNIPNWKIIMKKANAPPVASEMLGVIHHFMRLRSRFKVIMPAHLAAAKAKLAAARGEGSSLSQGDHALVYSLGALLVEHQSPVSMSEIARALDVPMSSATRLVDWLVSTDYAVRQPDPGDRRVVRVALTPGGQVIYNGARDYMLERVQKLLAHFTPEEQKTMVSLLGRMAVALEEEQNEAMGKG